MEPKRQDRGSKIQGVGLRIVGCWNQGRRIRIWSSRFMVSGEGFRVKGEGLKWFGVQESGHQGET